MEKLSGALLRFRVMAYVTGVVLGALTVWLVIGYGFLDYANTEVKPDLYRWLWTAHGWLYLVYLIAGVDLCFRIKLSVIRTLAVLLAALLLILFEQGCIRWEFSTRIAMAEGRSGPEALVHLERTRDVFAIALAYYVIPVLAALGATQLQPSRGESTTKAS